VLIREMTKQESLDVLAKSHFGILACAREGQPYIVPTYFAYFDNCLYSFSTIGQKIDWMRANPLVCLQTDEVLNAEHWLSVIVFGRFEELLDVPQSRSERALAHQLLQKKPKWWEPGYVKTISHGIERHLLPVYYRIRITDISGHRAVADADNDES
jgi:uncharacterized protein